MKNNFKDELEELIDKYLLLDDYGNYEQNSNSVLAYYIQGMLDHYEEIYNFIEEQNSIKEKTIQELYSRRNTTIT